MNASTTLYRFRISLSDIDRGIYENLDFRLAKHPSENMQYLFTRVLAFALNTQEELEFSPQGLGDPDVPAILAKHMNGRISLWIEIGNPSARKLHKAAKAAEKVRVYTYKDPQVLINEARSEKIHRSNEIEIFSIDPQFLDRITQDLPKDVRMSVISNDKILSVDMEGKNEQTELQQHGIQSAP